MQKNGSNNLDSLYFSISVFCSRPVPYCSVYSIYRHAHISIIGRNAVLYSFFGAYFYGNKMQMYSTVPVLAVKGIVLSLRSLAN